MSNDDILIEDGRRPNFYWVYNQVNTEFGLRIRAAGIAVYTALVLNARGRSEFAVSLPTLTAHAGLENREATLAALARLEETKLIKVMRAPGCANRYRILDIGQSDGDAVRPVSPRARRQTSQPVGISDGLSVNQSEKPTGQPVGKTDGLNGNQSEIPTGPVGKTDGTSRKNRLLHKNKIDKISRRRIDLQTHDDDFRASQPVQPLDLKTWDDLIGHYGQKAVLEAQDAAANQAKRNDFAYIRGVLRRRAQHGQAPARPDIFASTPSLSIPVEDDNTPDGSDLPRDDQPESPDMIAWKQAKGLLTLAHHSAMPVLESTRVVVEDGMLIVVARNDYARGWLQNRMGERILDAWHEVGGTPVRQLNVIVGETV